MTTYHLGDCSSDCIGCARLCIEAGHDGCTGTEAERAQWERTIEDEELAKTR